jgi:hypothetical protein
MRPTPKTRMPRRSFPAPYLGIALVAGALAGTGCGSSFKLPTEQLQNRVIPGDQSYQRIATWEGMIGVTDALLIPGPQLYFAFRGNPGRVEEYSTTVPAPLATGRFPNVRNPAALAASPASVFVLDQGDTAAARDTVGAWYELASTSGCGRSITNTGSTATSRGAATASWSEAGSGTRASRWRRALASAPRSIRAGSSGVP